MLPHKPNPLLKEQLEWLRGGKCIYVEWTTRRGSFYGNIRAQGTGYLLEGIQECRLLERSRYRELQTREVIETFEDESALIAFLRSTSTSPKLWNAVAKLRNGGGLGISYENKDSGTVRGSAYMRGNVLVVHTREVFYDQMTPSSESELTYEKLGSQIAVIRGLIEEGESGVE